MVTDRHRAWKPEDTKQLRDLWSQRVPLKEISEITGRTISAINNQRIRLKLPQRNYRSQFGGEKVDENSVRVYLPHSYMEALDKVVAQTGRSRSSIVRDLVGQLLAKAA